MSSPAVAGAFYGRLVHFLFSFDSDLRSTVLSFDSRLMGRFRLSSYTRLTVLLPPYSQSHDYTLSHFFQCQLHDC